MELLGISGELLDRRVDLGEGGGLVELGQAGLESLEPLRRYVMGGETREEGSLALEGVAGESEVDAKGSVEAREEEIGSDVGEESDARLRRKRGQLGSASERKRKSSPRAFRAKWSR